MHNWTIGEHLGLSGDFSKVCTARAQKLLNLSFQSADRNRAVDQDLSVHTVTGRLLLPVFECEILYEFSGVC